MKTNLPVCALAAVTLLLAGCGPSPVLPIPGLGNTPAPAANQTSVATLPPAATIDPCTPAGLQESVKIVNTYVHQFDSYATLAIQVPSSQLPQMVASMKTIRQAASQQGVPTCLTVLKHYGLQYMDTVIQTVSDFQASPNIDKLNAGIEQARTYNDRYAGELARLLGVTLAAPSETGVAQSTAGPSETPAPAVVAVLNPGPNPLNLHVSPSLTSESIGMLNAGETATAFGRSSNGEWIQIEVPGQTGERAWVYASLIQVVSGDAVVLPVATP